MKKSPNKIYILDIINASKLLIAENIDPKTFSETGSNPNAETVIGKFKEVGLKDILVKIKPKFEQKWKKPVADTFIKDKLNEIVRTRHVVAHTNRTSKYHKKKPN